MEIIDVIANKYYGCYIYVKKYIRKNCNFYFDYEEMLLWEYYCNCKRISKNYNEEYDYKNIIISNLIKRMFQYYKRNKDNVNTDYDDCLLYSKDDNISIDKIMCKEYPIAYDYLYNNYTVREIRKKYNISQKTFYDKLKEFYDKEYKKR